MKKVTKIVRDHTFFLSSCNSQKYLYLLTLKKRINLPLSIHDSPAGHSHNAQQEKNYRRESVYSRGDNNFYSTLSFAIALPFYKTRIESILKKLLSEKNHIVCQNPLKLQ